MPIYAHRPAVCALLLAAAALAPRGTAAQTPAAPSYRQTVVVTGTATPAELGSVTRTLTIITREQIAALPVHSVADALRLVASVDVRARGERGMQSDFAVRGANFGQMLVLVDGVRLNDAQSAHHNGDIPVPLDAVERIEVLHGPGSSLYGADAFGGAVNVITRRDAASSSLVLQGGSFGLASGRGRAVVDGGRVQQTIAASADRSSGFMYDRDFASAIAHARTTIGSRSSVTLAFLRKEFGANNFYGGNAPSREWTNHTLAAVDHRLMSGTVWTVDAAGSYRTHGDRFLFNQEQPRLSDNRHRTHAVLMGVTATRPVGSRATLAAGGEGGGDWIRSTNLGDHAIGRASGFAEWRHTLSPRLQWDAGLRIDGYSEFGASASPSFGVGWWPLEGGTGASPDAGPGAAGAAAQSAAPRTALRLRASAGRAFRVPTFTERFYSDPANLARPDVGPETAWAGEGGADLFLAGGWTIEGTVFGRADRDVIDWLRPTTAERWRTYNIRSVATRGVELALRKALPNGFVEGRYTALDLDAAAVDQLSKYVLDYAPRSLTAAGSMTLPAGFHVAPRIEYRRRARSSGTSDYVLLDARVGRRLGERLDLFVDGTNLFDVRYEEVAGVRMPGAAMSVSLALRTR